MRRRYVYVDGEAFEVTQDWTPEPPSGLQIIQDIQPYRSMIDGREITSRSKHREHLKQHGCVEVGNDSSLSQKPQPLQSPPGLKDEILKAAYQHGFLRR